jgi:hypothetical protein
MGILRPVIIYLKKKYIFMDAKLFETINFLIMSCLKKLLNQFSDILFELGLPLLHNFTFP